MDANTLPLLAFKEKRKRREPACIEVWKGLLYVFRSHSDQQIPVFGLNRSFTRIAHQIGRRGCGGRPGRAPA